MAWRMECGEAMEGAVALCAPPAVQPRHPRVHVSRCRAKGIEEDPKAEMWHDEFRSTHLACGPHRPAHLRTQGINSSAPSDVSYADCTL